MSATYWIKVSGCDDSTAVDMELSDVELAFVRRLAERLTAESEYDCQPTMSVAVVAAPDPMEEGKS